MFLSKLSSKIKKYLLYAGIGKNRFNLEFHDIERNMCVENQQNISIFSFLTSIILLAMLITSFCLSSFAKYRPMYLVTFIVSAITCIGNKSTPTKSLVSIRISYCLFIFAIHLFSILIGTVYSPNETSAIFIVMLVVSPLVFVDLPIYFVSLSFVSYIIFIVMCVLFKAPQCIPTDIINASSILFLTVFSCIYTMNVKVQKLFLEQRTRSESETDVLTGLKNRACFENNIKNYSYAMLRDTFFVYIDANGLHDINNKHGHAAGDEMLRVVSECIVNHFGQNTYRIGGDEFVVFGTYMDAKGVEASIDALNNAVAKHGYSVAAGYAIDPRVNSIVELMNLAEVKMYEAKTQYYQTAGIDRRNRLLTY